MHGAGHPDPDDQTDDEDDEDDHTLIPYDPSNESYAERFYALKDMISPKTRATLATHANQGIAAAWVLKTWVGKSAWLVCTTAILMGLPLALSVESEMVFAQQERMEREQLAGQQQVRRFLSRFLSR